MTVADRFTAFRIHRTDARVSARFETLSLDDLGPGEVVVAVQYSSINYKDALAATGAGAILRRFPLVGGIDFAGVVVESAAAGVAPGARVLACGCGLSETHDGGYSEFARVPADWLVPIPDSLDARAAMALGTAGLTVALAVERLETNGQTPALGPIVVTGATGGVGSLAIDVLASRGYEVVALTGKSQHADYLSSLGAASVLDRHALTMGTRPLETSRWGGAVDSVGGDVIAWLLRTTHPWGNVASVGLAAGAAFSATVLPFILRGVSLLGVNSVELPRARRVALWSRLAGDLAPQHLDRIVTAEVPFEDLPKHFERFVEGQVRGRTVVRIGAG
jgi:NADPH2:quinone reductase